MGVHAELMGVVVCGATVVGSCDREHAHEECERDGL